MVEKASVQAAGEGWILGSGSHKKQLPQSQAFVTSRSQTPGTTFGVKVEVEKDFQAQATESHNPFSFSLTPFPFPWFSPA